MTTDETAVEQVRKEKNYGMLMPKTEAGVPMVYEHLGIAGAPPETPEGFWMYMVMTCVIVPGKSSGIFARVI